MPFQATRVPAAGQPVEAGWRSRGACRDHLPDLFFPAASAPAELVGVQEATARAVCRSCPVLGECLAFALGTRPSFGVWAGLSAGDRRALFAATDQAGASAAVQPSAVSAVAPFGVRA